MCVPRRSTLIGSGGFLVALRGNIHPATPVSDAAPRCSIRRSRHGNGALTLGCALAAVTKRLDLDSAPLV